MNVAPQVDLTARTFNPLLQRALDLLKARVGSFRYGSFVATDIVPAILSVLAWFQEQNAFYFTRLEINSILVLADTREAMSYLTQGQGYRMRPATSASIAIQATPTPPQPVPITLRKGTKLTVGDLTFEIAVDAIIPANAAFWPDGSTDDLIVLVEGTTRNETFTSDGASFQQFELGQPGTIESSIVVTVLDETWSEVASLVFVEGDQRGRDTFVGTGEDSQTFSLSLLNAIVDPEDEDAIVVFVTSLGATSKWQQVAAFTGAPREYTVVQNSDGTTDLIFGLAADGAAPKLDDTVDVLYLITGAQKRYQVTYDSNDRATIRFGDGVFGLVPPNGARIVVSYRTGGGVRGNVPSGFVATTISGFLPNGARTSVQITNVERGSGGEAPETVDHARFFAPRYAKSNVRAVTQGDWTALAATYFDPLYGAPAHASAYLKQRVPELNTVRVAVWSRDETGRLTTAGSPLKAAIKNFLNTKRTITTVVEMLDGVVVFLDMDINVTLEEGKVREVVFAAVTAAIEQFFRSTQVLPGVDVSISQLYDAIQEVEGVARAEITRIVGSVRLTLSLGTGDGATNLFPGQFVLQEGTAIVPQSFAATDTIQQLADNGLGSFTGNFDPTITPGNPGNTIDYSRGSFSVAFTAPPLAGKPITAEARLTIFVATEEDLGVSDGSVASVDGATERYPIVERAPAGAWSGDQRKVIDSFQVGTTAQVRGFLPKGILPGTLTIVDSTGLPQTVTDDGSGGLLQGVTPVGTVSYSTGQIDLTFLAIPTKVIKATWQTRRVVLVVPTDVELPLAKGRLFVFGGYDADGAQPGAQLIAYDDGEGNMAGNVLADGTINYDTGVVDFEWNVNPPPGPAGGAAVTITLVPAPDGVTRAFDFTFPGDLSSVGLDGEGRVHFRTSDLSRPGVVFEDAYDNWQGRIDGPSIDKTGDNLVNYAIGTGKITFEVAPAASAPGTFVAQVSNVATFLYAAFAYRVKDPSNAGLEKGLFADNRGRFWGPPGGGPQNTFPTAKLDHLRGRYSAQLQGSPVPSGRLQTLTYDAFVNVPPALDLPISGSQVAASGRISLLEKPPETNGQVGG